MITTTLTTTITKKGLRSEDCLESRESSREDQWTQPLMLRSTSGDLRGHQVPQGRQGGFHGAGAGEKIVKTGILGCIIYHHICIYICIYIYVITVSHLTSHPHLIHYYKNHHCLSHHHLIIKSSQPTTSSPHPSL